MRVLIFHGYMLRGTGSNIYNVNLARALARLGHEVHLLCQDREVRIEGVEIHNPDIGGLLPVYVRDPYEGFEVKTFPELKKRYIDTGKVRFIFREFALNDVDLLAIVTVRCAPKERYFALVETLFEKQDVWAVNNPVPPLLGIAKQAGFTDESFKACASNQQIIEGVKAQRETGSKVGVNSTPTFFINGEKHVGGLPIEEMEKLIQPYLKAG